MTLKEFATIVRESKINTDSKTKIIVNVFKCSKTAKKIDPDTVSSWFYKNRVCKTSTYFPDNKLDEKGFISYFRNRSGDPFKRLQEAFSSVENDNIVDCTTDDEDAFYQSLLRQFMLILGIPWLDETHDNKLKNKDTAIIDNIKISDLPSIDESINFLCEQAKDNDTETATEIAIKLRRLPLNLERAIDFIVAYNVSLVEYLDLLWKYGIDEMLNIDVYSYDAAKKIMLLRIARHSKE